MRSNIALRSTMGFIITTLLLAGCQGQSGGDAGDAVLTSEGPTVATTARPPASTLPEDVILDLAQGTANVGHPFAVETSPDGTQAVVSSPNQTVLGCSISPLGDGCKH